MMLGMFYDSDLYKEIIMGCRISEWMLDEKRKPFIKKDIQKIQLMLQKFITTHFDIWDFFKR